ncbi:MAG: YicC family protein [Candidatus Omnitrophica bacterium]|nr:YicC family protein [Candidatus Omnitrophota bacterium]MCB9719567.1 YicC family protein [Candidatus Omnitrophota bacterium]
MIKGMTGFGSSELTSGSVKAIVEIKSLNHRYFDISYYLPIGFGSIEQKLRQLVQSTVQRGRVTVAIKITEKPTQTVVFHKDVVKDHMRYAKQLQKEFGLENNLTLSDVVRLPGVIETKESLVQPEKVWPSLQKSLTKALTALEQMRKSEGRSLAKDVGEKLRGMSAQLSTIQARAKAILAEAKKQLSPEEFASLQKGLDINEEIARLKHYIVEVRTLLKSKVSVGKKIDFIAQEMQRETNTIGSKLQDKIVSNAVIALKSKIEKIREQAQNIE